MNVKNCIMSIDIFTSNSQNCILSIYIFGINQFYLKNSRTEMYKVKIMFINSSTAI